MLLRVAVDEGVVLQFVKSLDGHAPPDRLREFADAGQDVVPAAHRPVQNRRRIAEEFVDPDQEAAARRKLVLVLVALAQIGHRMEAQVVELCVAMFAQVRHDAPRAVAHAASSREKYDVLEFPAVGTVHLLGEQFVDDHAPHAVAHQRDLVVGNRQILRFCLGLQACDVFEEAVHQKPRRADRLHGFRIGSLFVR